MAIHPEVFLAAGYAVFLVCVSLGLDSLARHSHARSERYRIAGFTYHHTNDAWICPEDQLLLRGREVVHAMDPWPHSEAGRFHRGISLAVVLIAGLVLAAETLRNHAPLELAVLGAVFLAVVLTAWHLHAVFRASPANFPTSPPRVPAEPVHLGYSKGKGTGRLAG